MTTMHWTQVVLVLPARDLDAVEAVLFALGALAVAQADAGGTPWYEPGADATSPWEHVRLQALFAPGNQNHTIPARCQNTGIRLPDSRRCACDQRHPHRRGF